MKSEIYSVDLTFSVEGEYLHDASKCDCPNGWLFCSHMLGFGIFLVLVKDKDDWTYDDLSSFMPQPIKFLQNIVFAAEFAAELVTKGRAKVNDNTGEDESASIGRCEAAVDKVGKKITDSKRDAELCCRGQG